MRVTFAGKCKWLEDAVTGGDRYMVEFHRALLSEGVEVRCVREPRFPAENRFLLPAAVLWSFSLNAWYIARRRDFASSVIFEDYSSRTRLFLSNKAFRRVRGAKVVSLVQGFYHSIFENPARRKLEEKIARAYVQSLDFILANSHSTAVEAVGLGARSDRIRVVHPGLDDLFMRVSPQPKAKMGEPVRILFVGGQCKPVKGLEYLISAVGLLKDRDLHLTLVGETTGCHFRAYVDRLRRMCCRLGVQKKVEFAGLMSPTNGLIDMYRQSDIFVLPSLWEGFGIAALEAMCFGLPVVATRSGGITEVVDDGETGLLVPPRDSQSLAAALAKIMDDTALWRDMSGAAAVRAREMRRSWKSVGEECLRHVEELWLGTDASSRAPADDDNRAPGGAGLSGGGQSSFDDGSSGGTGQRGGQRPCACRRRLASAAGAKEQNMAGTTQ